MNPYKTFLEGLLLWCQKRLSHEWKDSNVEALIGAIAQIKRELKETL